MSKLDPIWVLLFVVIVIGVAMLGYKNYVQSIRCKGTGLGAYYVGTGQESNVTYNGKVVAVITDNQLIPLASMCLELYHKGSLTPALAISLAVGESFSSPPCCFADVSPYLVVVYVETG